MVATPVEIIGLDYPLNKWQKRTKNMLIKWPKEGTFDVVMCEKIETLIKNYQTKSISKKREVK